MPEIGGDTTWTNLVAAHQDLSEPVRSFVDTLRARARGDADRFRRPGPGHAACSVPANELYADPFGALSDLDPDASR